MGAGAAAALYIYYNKQNASSVSDADVVYTTTEVLVPRAPTPPNHKCVYLHEGPGPDQQAESTENSGVELISFEGDVDASSEGAKDPAAESVVQTTCPAQELNQSKTPGELTSLSSAGNEDSMIIVNHEDINKTPATQ